MMPSSSLQEAKLLIITLLDSLQSTPTMTMIESRIEILNNTSTRQNTDDSDVSPISHYLIHGLKESSAVRNVRMSLRQKRKLFYATTALEERQSECDALRATLVERDLQLEHLRVTIETLTHQNTKLNERLQAEENNKETAVSKIEQALGSSKNDAKAKMEQSSTAWQKKVSIPHEVHDNAQERMAFLHPEDSFLGRKPVHQENNSNGIKEQQVIVKEAEWQATANNTSASTEKLKLAVSQLEKAKRRIEVLEKEARLFQTFNSNLEKLLYDDDEREATVGRDTQQATVKQDRTEHQQLSDCNAKTSSLERGQILKDSLPNTMQSRYREETKSEEDHRDTNPSIQQQEIFLQAAILRKMTAQHSQDRNHHPSSAQKPSSGHTRGWSGFGGRVLGVTNKQHHCGIFD